LIFRRGKRASFQTIICYERTCPLGRIEHPVRPAPESKLRPAIRARCVVGDSPDGAPGIFTLRRFVPDDRCADVSTAAGLRAVYRSLAPIDFRRGIVRPEGESNAKKDGRSMSLRFGFQAWLLSSIRAEAILGHLCLGRSCLGLCLFQGYGHRNSAFERARPRPDHQPPEYRFRPLSAPGFFGVTIEMNRIVERFARYTVTGLIPVAALPVPSACSRG